MKPHYLLSKYAVVTGRQYHVGRCMIVTSNNYNGREYYYSPSAPMNVPPPAGKLRRSAAWERSLTRSLLVGYALLRRIQFSERRRLRRPSDVVQPSQS